MINVKENVPTGMVLTDNEKVLSAVENRLNKFTEGYCPCVPNSIGNSDYKCPCKKARTEQSCCCGIYHKVN